MNREVTGSEHEISETHGPGTDDDVALTEDLLLGGRVRLKQPKAGFRAAIDPVILAAAIPARPGDLVELGCGTGAASLCFLKRLSEKQLAATSVLGFELQPHLAELARQNAEVNGLAEIFDVITADLRRLPTMVEPCSFDHAFFNPPFHRRESERAPNGPNRALASHADDGALEDWVDAANMLLKPRGRLTLVYRADRLMDLMDLLPGRFGGLSVFPLWPGRGKPAKRVLAVAQKGSRAPLTLLPGLTLHQDDGRFTAEAEEVLRGGAGIAIG